MLIILNYYYIFITVAGNLRLKNTIVSHCHEYPIWGPTYRHFYWLFWPQFWKKKMRNNFSPGLSRVFMICTPIITQYLTWRPGCHLVFPAKHFYPSKFQSNLPKVCWRLHSRKYKMTAGGHIGFQIKLKFNLQVPVYNWLTPESFGQMAKQKWRNCAWTEFHMKWQMVIWWPSWNLDRTQKWPRGSKYIDI